MPRWIYAALCALSVPVAGVIIWGAWVYTTWALQARSAGLVSALVILAAIAGVIGYRESRP